MLLQKDGKGINLVSSKKTKNILGKLSLFKFHKVSEEGKKEIKMKSYRRDLSQNYELEIEGHNLKKLLPGFFLAMY